MNFKTLKTQAKTFFATAKRSSLMLPIAGSLALVAGGSVAFWALTRSNLTAGTLPIGATVIPQDSLLVLTVSTDPGQWQQLRTFGTPTSQAAFDQQIAQVRDRFLTNNRLDYERDIQPWVGSDASFALLSPQGETRVISENLRTPTPQPAVLILPIRDSIKAKERLEQSRRDSTLTWNTRKYKGIDIQESQGESRGADKTQALSIAALDNQILVIANSARSIDRTIDTYKGEKDNPSLAQTPGFTSALGQIQTGASFAKLYLNLPEMTAVSLPSAVKKPTQNPTQGWAVTANLNNDGVQFSSLLWLKPDSDRKFTPQDATQTLPDRLPAETFMLISGSNFKQFWTDYSRDYGTSPIKLLDPTSFKQEVRGAMGMDFEQDFTNWMGGEFALSAVAAPSESAPNGPASFPIGLVLMVQASDRRAADRAFTQIDDTLQRKYSFKIEPGKVGTQDVVNWTMGNGGTSNGGINITRGWLDNNVAFITLGAPIAPIFVPKPSNAITQDGRFRQVIPTQPTLKGGNFFVDIDRTSTFKNVPLLRGMDAFRAWSDAIKSIGVNTRVTDDRTTRYDAVVILKRGATPGVLPSRLLPSPSPSPKTSPSVPGPQK